MGKINIKLNNGVMEEKNVLSAFNTANANYVVLDNQAKGSMGLPIILVTKLIDNNLSKINDQNEWQITKENLKSIISGVQMDYINVPSEINASDNYYTQLTLPEASFAAIRDNYKAPVETFENVQIVTEDPFVPNIDITPIQNQTPTPVMPEAPTPQFVQTPPLPVIEPVIPTVPMPEPVIPEVPMPEVVQTPVVPVIEPEIPTIQVPEPVAPTENNPVITPDLQNMPQMNVSIPSDDKYKDMKETFMKSCENMFDALIKQIENKE